MKPTRVYLKIRPSYILRAVFKIWFRACKFTRTLKDRVLRPAYSVLITKLRTLSKGTRQNFSS